MATKTTFATPKGTWERVTLGPGPAFVVLAQDRSKDGPVYAAGFRATEEEAAWLQYMVSLETGHTAWWHAATAKVEVPDAEAHKSLNGILDWVRRK